MESEFSASGIFSPSIAGGGAAQAVAQILVSFFRGEFQEGDRLTEQSLVDRFGISRTPVREALVNLQGLGIVELHRNRGAIVRRFDEVKLREIYEVRRLLEAEAAAKACGRIDEETVAEFTAAVRRLLEQEEEDEDWALDQNLHRTIARACGNERLADEIDRYSSLVQAIRMTVGERAARQRITSEQHLEILTAIASSQPDQAAAAMRRHLQQAEDSAVAAIDWKGAAESL